MPCREDAFSTLTPEVAYWLGFLFAEGCLTGPRKTLLSVSQAPAERDQLEALRRFLSSPNAISEATTMGFGKKHAFLLFRVGSSRLAADLKGWGMTPRKRDRGAAHPELASSPHFWRGVLDGDGSLGIAAGRRRPQICLVACGPKALMEQFNVFCRSTVPEWHGRQAKPAQVGNIWYLRLGGNRAANLAGHIYASGLSMPRKAAAVEAMLAARGPGVRS